MPLDAQRRQELTDRFARRVVELGMTAPAILFLEAYKPLSFLGAQLLWMTGPFLNGVFNSADLRDFTLLIEDAAGVEALIARLESFRQDEPVSCSPHRT